MRLATTPEALGRGGGARAWMPPEGGPSRMTETLPDSTRHSTAPQRARGHGGVPAGETLMGYACAPNRALGARFTKLHDQMENARVISLVSSGLVTRHRLKLHHY